MPNRRWNKTRVTIKDIAKAAGVDPSTVTRALQGSERVKKATRDKVSTLATEMGYVANQAARTLVTRRSRIVGLAIPDMTNPFFADLARGIEDEAQKHDLRVLIRNTDGREALERDAIRFFLELKVDGIVAPMARCPRSYYDTLQAPVPIVHVNREDTPFHVSCDRKAGSLSIMNHLLSLGHRSIAFIAGPSGPASEPKMQAYREALASSGINYNPDLVFSFNGKLDDTNNIVAQMLELPEVPTAVFAWNDICAIGMMHVLTEHGWRVPDDISIAGHDDLAIARFVDPSLTTVHWPLYELGQQSIKYLYRLHEGQRARRPTVPMPTTRIRQSTGAPATGKRGGNA